MSRSSALRFVVLGLAVIVIHHTIQVGCCRCSWDLDHRRRYVGRMRRAGIEPLEDIDGASSRHPSAFRPRIALYTG
jgi:hypothetical protein